MYLDRRNYLTGSLVDRRDKWRSPGVAQNQYGWSESGSLPSHRLRSGSTGVPNVTKMRHQLGSPRVCQRPGAIHSIARHPLCSGEVNLSLVGVVLIWRCGSESGCPARHPAQ